MVFMPAASEQRHLDRATQAYRAKEPTSLIQAELAGAARSLSDDPWPNALAARVLAERGLLERAIIQQQQAVAKSPHDWTGHFDLARLLAEEARRSEKQQGWTLAIEAMQRALQCYPTKPELHEELANMYAEQRNWADAVEHYKRALDYDRAKKLDAKYQWPIEYRLEVQDKLDAAQRRLAAG